jgi:hypothetical protein
MEIIEDNILPEEECIAEEVEPLEGWMTEDPRGGYYLEDTIQDNFDELYKELESLEKRIIGQGLHIQNEKSELEKEDIVLKGNKEETAKYAQQPGRDHNRGIHPETELDKEIDILWMMMRKTSKRRYYRRRRTTNNEDKLTKRLCINKASRQLQTKVWDPGGFHQHMKAHDQEIMNVFNLGSLMQVHPASKFIVYLIRPRGL